MHAPLPLTLGDILESNAARYADQPAWIDGERQLTHADLLARGHQLVNALLGCGLRSQDRVSILAMNTLEYAEVFAACWTSGLIASTVNFRLSGPEIAWIVNDSSPKVMIFEAQYLSLIDGLRAELKSVKRFVCIGGSADWAQDYEDFLISGDPATPPIRAKEEDIAMLVYTSGTTGRPKGCMMGHRELRALCALMAVEQRSAVGHRVLLCMPLFHIGASAVGLSHLFRAGTIVLHRQFDPATLLTSVENDRINLLHLAPTMLQMMLEQPDIDQRDLSSVHTVIYSAAPMPTPVLKRGLELFGKVFLQYYGQTEVISTVLLKEQHRPDGSVRERGWLGSVGQPFMNSQIKAVHDNGEECLPGEAGEIVTRSPAMFRGYWNNHAATLETIRDGWCHTGDVGKFDADGNLYLVDRIKDMIISGGENIYSREVEEALVQHPAVSEVAVIGLPDSKWGEAVYAVVVRKRGAMVSAEELIAHCKQLIASYKKPRSVIFADELPKLPTGKINKVGLRQRYGAQQEAASTDLLTSAQQTKSE